MIIAVTLPLCCSTSIAGEGGSWPHRSLVLCSTISRSEVLMFLYIYNFQPLSNCLLCCSPRIFAASESVRTSLINFLLLSSSCLQPIREALSVSFQSPFSSLTPTIQVASCSIIANKSAFWIVYKLSFHVGCWILPFLTPSAPLHARTGCWCSVILYPSRVC